jgi:DNA-binding transcriptional MerR regulator
MDELLLPEVTDVGPDGLSISQVSRETGVSVEALRYYERAGLMLRPPARDASRRRRYDARDLAWVAGLVMLRETGMSIADVRAVAEVSRRPGTEGERLALLEAHRDRVVAELERTRRHLAAIERKIAAYREVAAGGES